MPGCQVDDQRAMERRRGASSHDQAPVLFSSEYRNGALSGIPHIHRAQVDTK